MINRFIGALLFVSCSIVANSQTEKVISMEGGNGLVKANGFTDSNGYSALVFQFSPRSSVFVLLDPNLKEISRHVIKATKLSIDGFSSTSNEFIVYFKGIVTSAKTKPYFVALFKDGRVPLQSDWLDIPEENDEVFSYSYNDKFYVATNEKFKNVLKVFEVSTVNNVQVKSFKMTQETLSILKDSEFKENESWGAFMGGDGIINAHLDSLRIIFSEKERTKKVDELKIITLNYINNSIKERVFIGAQFNSPELSVIDDVIFILDNEKGLSNKIGTLSIGDLKSLKIINQNKIDHESLGSQIKLGPLVNMETGDVSKEEIDNEVLKKYINQTGGLNLIGVHRTQEILNVRLGGTIIDSKNVGFTPSPGPGFGPGFGSTSVQSPPEFEIFSVGVDEKFNIVWQEQNDEYFSLFKKFQEQKLNKLGRKNDKLYFVSTPDRVMSLCYFNKSNEAHIFLINRK